ncbi:MAG: hypothetical protein FIB06_06310 [Betaproteobacteria bacterium]|nr:hypothetical protein [Betaproteobacteria bacterium]
MVAINLFQIYYDENSKGGLEKGYVPLDNTENLRPEWFEFHVIRQFLLANQLSDNAWYGFFSTKVRDKSTLTYDEIRRFVEFSEGKADVALISVGWDQLSFFRNPFEQGDFFHPGITQFSQYVVDRLGYKLDLKRSIGHTGNFAFSNFIVAKLRYWAEWLRFANFFYDLVENWQGGVPDVIRGDTRYLTDHAAEAPFRTFIQERMPFVILVSGGYRTTTYALHDRLRIYDEIFVPGDETRAALVECDRHKRAYLATGNREFLELYYQARASVPFKFPEMLSGREPETSAGSLVPSTI